MGKGKWNGAYYYYFSKTDKQLAVDKLFSVKLEHLMNFLSSHEVLIRPYKTSVSVTQAWTPFGDLAASNRLGQICIPQPLGGWLMEVAGYCHGKLVAKRFWSELK